MKIAATKKYMFSLETVAITDIIMNLFIFFFISFSLLYTFNPSRTEQIKVNLPRAKHAAAPEAKDATVRVTLTREGPIYLGNKVVTLKELESQLHSLVSVDPGMPVIVAIDKMVVFKNVVDVLDVLNGLKINSLRIAVEETEK